VTSNAAEIIEGEVLFLGVRLPGQVVPAKMHGPAKEVTHLTVFTFPFEVRAQVLLSLVVLALEIGPP